MTPSFFYGTLMVPKVLASVTTGTPDLPQSIEIRRGQLDGYRRCKVQAVAYPAVTPSEGSSVVGTVVYGLNDKHMDSLDTFEGDEFVRTLVTVLDSESGQQVQAYTYVFKTELQHMLSDEDWSLDVFKQLDVEAWLRDDMPEIGHA